MVRQAMEAGGEAGGGVDGGGVDGGGVDGGGGGGVRSSAAASRQVRMLYKAGKGLLCGTDEDVFIEVLGFADAAHAAALRY
eukprot:37923-Prymnesium_polylepis.1